MLLFFLTPQEPPKVKTTRVIMKFGGSSLANAERIDYVAKLIKSQIAKGYRPTVVCSAMGKTTNNLLNAGHFALEGNVYVDSLRTLHLTTAQELGMGNDTVAAIEELLDELKNLLNGVSYLRELTPRTLDYLVRGWVFRVFCQMKKRLTYSSLPPPTLPFFAGVVWRAPVCAHHGSPAEPAGRARAAL